MSNLHQLFVYGSLRSGFGHPAFQFISRYFRLVSHGKTKGLLYDLGEYPAAIPTTEEKYIVGELYAIKQPDEWPYALAQLDDYEGINPEEGEALYHRATAEIYTETGKTQAMVYWYNGSVQGFPLIESGDMLAYHQAKNNQGK